VAGSVAVTYEKQDEVLERNFGLMCINRSCTYKLDQTYGLKDQNQENGSSTDMCDDDALQLLDSMAQ
jgi:hypothetical protein